MTKFLLPFICVTFAVALAGCFQSKPSNGRFDLSNIPEKVAVLTLDSPYVIFSELLVSQTEDQVITITNTGPYPASRFALAEGSSLSAPFSFADGTFPGTGGTCPEEIAPEESCTIVIRFAPTAVGSYMTQLQLEYINGIIVAPLTIDLMGQTTSPLRFTVASYDFGMVDAGLSATGALTVENQGATGVTGLEELSSQALLPPFSFVGGVYPGTGGTCGATLAGGASCTVQLQFAPGTVLHYYDMLTLHYFDGLDEFNLSIPLFGQGI